MNRYPNSFVCAFVSLSVRKFVTVTVKLIHTHVIRYRSVENIPYWVLFAFFTLKNHKGSAASDSSEHNASAGCSLIFYDGLQINVLKDVRPQPTWASWVLDLISFDSTMPICLSRIKIINLSFYLMTTHTMQYIRNWYSA